MYDESDYVLTEVMGEEREHTMRMIIDVFTALLNHKDSGTGFPIWGESMAKLMELAYVLTKLRIFIHHPTGTPATMKDIACGLCEALHCDVPKNIYQPASRQRLRGRKSIVDYYAMLWREGKTSPAISLLWAEPIQFPKIHNYRVAFDSSYYRNLHSKKRSKGTANIK